MEHLQGKTIGKRYKPKCKTQNNINYKVFPLPSKQVPMCIVETPKNVKETLVDMKSLYPIPIIEKMQGKIVKLENIWKKKKVEKLAYGRQKLKTCST